MAGRPRPVREVMALLGSNPLICCPISADNPTKNYGSGGDFTLNGGGLVGARGASEYIARSGYFDGSTKSYLTKAETSDFSGKTFTMVISGVHNGSTINVFQPRTPSNNYSILAQFGSNSGGNIRAYNSTGTEILYHNINGSTSNGTGMTILFSCDLSTNTSNMYVIYSGGVITSTAGTVINDTIDLDIDTYYVNGYWNGTEVLTNASGSTISSTYFTTDYIDFSQESTRNLFVSQLGYPRDLQPLIDDGTIPNPLIYLPFDDTSNLGKNLGTGGDFSVVGTVTAGADFNI